MTNSRKGLPANPSFAPMLIKKIVSLLFPSSINAVRTPSGSLRCGAVVICAGAWSGGLLDTGLFTATRNRPAELERVKEHPPSPQASFAAFKKAMDEMVGGEYPIQDLDELGRFVVEQVQAGKYIIGKKLDEVGVMLHARADAIARGDLPPAMHN